jgi:two-component system CheB/CheR fusion protein
LIDRVVANSRSLADQKGLRIINTRSDLAAYSDPGLFERIIDNFVTNAVRYTETGGTITISCVRTDAGVRVAVEDTGVGIPEEALDRIFDEYVQIDNPARTRSNGLGLGLAIAKHIANLLDCRLSVASRFGQGSTFSVETQSAKVAPGLAAPRLHDTPEAAAPRRPLLLIEDDPMVADAVTMVLSDAGFAVTHVANGEDAVASLAAGLRPVLIVSDYWLPRSNGVDLIGQLRTALGAIVPALLVTGDTALQAGGVGLELCQVVHKPLEARKLTGVLRQFAA